MKLLPIPEKFERGDIVKLNAEGLDMNSGIMTRAHRDKYPNWRWQVIRIDKDDVDLDGNPILHLKRLDTKSPEYEKWSPAWMTKATDLTI